MREETPIDVSLNLEDGTLSINGLDLKSEDIEMSKTVFNQLNDLRSEVVVLRRKCREARRLTYEASEWLR